MDKNDDSTKLIFTLTKLVGVLFLLFFSCLYFVENEHYAGLTFFFVLSLGVIYLFLSYRLEIWNRPLAELSKGLSDLIETHDISNRVELLSDREVIKNNPYLMDITQKFDSFLEDMHEEFLKIQNQIDDVKIQNSNLSTEMTDARNQSIQSEKLAAIGEMTASIIHEINNPLMFIRTLLKKHLKKSDADSDLAKDLEKTYMMTERVEKIIVGLKNLARNSDLDEGEVFAISEVINQSVFLCEHKLKKHNVKIEIMDISDSFMVKGNAVQISQIFVNLIKNATDAIDQLKEKWIKIECLTEGSMYKILVTDSGNGIPQEIRQKLMESFFTTKGKERGTGLGLSISRKIADRHKGDLYIDPDSQNTRFVLLLPILEE